MEWLVDNHGDKISDLYQNERIGITAIADRLEHEYICEYNVLDSLYLMDIKTRDQRWAVSSEEVKSAIDHEGEQGSRSGID